MKSKHGERFSHDDEAHIYDADVRNEANPLRAGYDALLQWAADHVNRRRCRTVLDLGIGTGNLTVKISAPRVVGVDISSRMLAIAREKLRDRPGVSFHHSDLLEFFDINHTLFDAVISTYAIHHLEPLEKHTLFAKIYECLDKNDIAVFGDMMFENDKERDCIFARYREEGHGAMVDEAEQEFYWNLETEVPALEARGFSVETRRFSSLSWGVLALRR